ncbi:ABC transporter transmembrane domain-containing protein [Nitrosomonas sp. Is35]|uniref:ABC transporter transmembrane domain-containing protein n=1 Tax=Nitrosomonas sp. Is35 TaxID=3080534 RepID=UPI00294ACD9C|nr:ABC transporter transmembrane domain-containing protein [Nitrosomonas sp. Is35]MDV6346518.1 ABC transporter transmembrane domain-containing protein [Nitrosomonas sp. Is35]
MPPQIAIVRIKQPANPQPVHVKWCVMIDLQHYHRLVRKLAPYWKLLLLALSAMLMVALLLAFLPLLVKHMLAGAFVLQDPSLIQTTSLTMVAVFAARGLAGYISLYATGKAGGKLGADLRMEFFNKLLTLPIHCYAHFNSHQTSALIAHINTIAQTTAGHLARLTQDCLTIIALMICTLRLNQEFAILLLLAIPLILLIHQMTQSRFNKPEYQHSPAVGDLIEHLAQSVAHYRKIRLDGGQHHESQRLGKISAAIYQADMQQTQIKAMAIPAGQLIMMLIMLAVAYIIALQAINGALDLPETGALITIVLLFILPLQRIANLPKQLEHDQTTLEAIFAFLDQPSEQDSGTLGTPQGCAKLVFDQVRYEDDTGAKPTLNHMHFTVRPGEVVVFTSYTLEEKNALIDLILCLRRPASGKILLNDQPLPDIQLNRLYANIALVATDTFLLDDKIAGNIAYGAMRCSNEAKITAAVQASHAIEFVRHMPEGLQTDISAKGTAITRHQLQQLAIARAFVKDPRILILDELFTPQEPDPGNLLPVLEKLMQNRTTLIFNPSIPQLQKIDRIFVLENGCIAESLRAADSPQHT